MPAEDVRLPERQESLHITKKDNRKKRKKECGWSLRPREGSSEGGRFPQLSKCGEIGPDWTEQKLQNLGGVHSNWFVEGKTESTLHRSALPSCYPQLDTLFCPWWWGLGAEAQVSEGSPRERTGNG